MDPIQPITPGLNRIAPSAGLPVDPLERISRERDRPSRDPQRRRREPPPAQVVPRDDDDGHPHVDVRV
jgi:hypothetical protein